MLGARLSPGVESPDHPLINLIDLEKVRTAIKHGIDWLMNETDLGQKFDPCPIGFYFAKLWYFEKLYPLIFTIAAMEAVGAMRTSAPTA